MPTAIETPAPLDRAAAVAAGMADGAGVIGFNDLYELLDAVMLFGGQIEPGKGASRQARISVARGWSQRPGLTWVVLSLHHHGIAMNLNSGPATTDRLVFASRFDRFYLPAAERWYRADGGGRRRAATPEDLRLTRPMAAVWLLAGLCQSAADGCVRLRAPAASELCVKRLYRQLRRYLPGVRGVMELRHTGATLELTPTSVRAGERWLKTWAVPEEVWH